MPRAKPSSMAIHATRTRSSSSAAIDGRPRLHGSAWAKGDRVATLAPNTHQHLEQYYAVPQLGAVLVPLNYRLVADDFVYLANHSGTKVLCVHVDYLDVIDSVRERMPGVEHFVALEGDKPGWLHYEAAARRERRAVRATGDRRDRTCSRSTTRAARRRSRRA